MEGLEGFKIVAERVLYEPTGLGLILVILSCLLLISGIVLTLVFLKFRYIAIVLIGGICLVSVDKCQRDPNISDTRKELKVIAIEEKYSIDLDKYEIMGSDGSIITIIEKEKRK